MEEWKIKQSFQFDLLSHYLPISRYNGRLSLGVKKEELKLKNSCLLDDFLFPYDSFSYSFYKKQKTEPASQLVERDFRFKHAQLDRCGVRDLDIVPRVVCRFIWKIVYFAKEAATKIIY
jgi:hypothetical protein